MSKKTKKVKAEGEVSTSSRNKIDLSSLKVESGIEMTRLTTSKWREFVGAFEPGDSFLAPSQGAVLSSIKAGKALGYKMASRKTEDGQRVFRVE